MREDENIFELWDGNPIIKLFDYISINLEFDKFKRHGIRFLKEFSKKFNLKFNQTEITGKINNTQIKCKFNISQKILKYELIINPRDDILYRLSFNNRVITGDRELDHYFHIASSNREQAFIKLNHKIRKKICDLKDIRQITIFENSIMFTDTIKENFLNENNIEKIISISEDIFKIPSDDNAIINNIENDTNENYKHKNILLLLESKNKTSYLNYFRKFMSNNDPDISIPSAALFGEEGINKIISIINTDTGNILSPITLQYIKKLDNNKIKKTICENLNNFQKEILIDVIKYICNSNEKWISKYLLDFITKHPFYSKSRIIVKEILKYFSYTKSRAGLNWTLEMLTHNESDVIVQALDTIEKIGNISCVEKINKSCGNYFDSHVFKKAKETIRILQKNIPEEHKGGLMIADDGKLSLSEETGKLSIEENANKDSTQE